jgi:hypothetical protein
MLSAATITPPNGSRKSNLMSRLNSSEAVMAFASWLTTRDKPITLSASHNAAAMAELADAFIKSQDMPEIRDDFVDRINTYPDA